MGENWNFLSLVQNYSATNIHSAVLSYLICFSRRPKPTSPTERKGTLKHLPLLGSCPCFGSAPTLVHLDSLIIHSRTKELHPSPFKKKIARHFPTMGCSQGADRKQTPLGSGFMFLETHHLLSNCTQYGKIMESCKGKKNLLSKLR